MRLFYADQFELPLPAGHFFPMAKYRLLRDRVLADEIARPDELFVPDAIGDEHLLRVHTADYVSRVQAGQLTPAEQRRIGFPWSLRMVERSRRSTGATWAATQAAFSDGVSINLAGGTHHAFADCGEGYCVFNDVAVAARAAQATGLARRALVIDCDAHQGNGTAAIFAEDPTVFTFSIHTAVGFPKQKMVSDLDIALPEGAEDDAYLAALIDGLATAFSAAAADMAFYIAGADPFSGDRLGHLRVSKPGLAERDRRVISLCRERGLPLAIAMGGGYSREVNDTVDIHAETVRQARRIYFG